MSLSYLCHTTAEKWAKTSAQLIERSEVFTRNTFNPMYPGTLSRNGSDIPVLFLPVYEVMELADIAKQKGEVCIITYEDMTNAIAHSVKKELLYYDVETMNEIDPDTVMIYDENGYEKGGKIIEAVLKEIGKTCSRTDIKKASESFGMTYIKLCNHVARNSIPLSEVLEKMEPEEMPDIVQKKHSSRTETTKISIAVSDAC